MAASSYGGPSPIRSARRIENAFLLPHTPLKDNIKY